MTVSLARLELLLADATERPWRFQQGALHWPGPVWDDYVPGPGTWSSTPEGKAQAATNAALICEAVNSLPALLAAVKAARTLDGPELRHWLGSQDVVGDAATVRIASRIHTLLHALAAFSFEEQA